MVFKAVLQSTPHHYLFEELFQTITDFQLWLKEIIIADNDQDCSYNAMLTMKFLSKLANSENMAEIESPSTNHRLKEQIDFNFTIRAIKHTSLK